MTLLTDRDRGALASVLDDAGLPADPIHDEALLVGGTQNVLIRFRRAGRDLVLRRPARPGPAGTATIEREARILASLAGTAVPHPALVAVSTDPEPLGTAFLVMERVDGVNPTVALPSAHRDRPAWRLRTGLDLARVAAAIGEVDWQAGGLAGLGRPDGFLERQVARWGRQLDSYREVEGYPGPNLPSVETVQGWLDRRRPERWAPGLMHGDLHLANVLVSSEEPAIAAVIDWEIATIGDPLLDLGTLLALWPDPHGDPDLPVHVDPPTGFPSRHEVIECYAAHSTRSVGAVRWYEAMACYRLAVLLEGSNARAWAGLADRATGDRLHRAAVALMARAERLVSDHGL